MTYRDKQKRAHFESFANKIFTGIREIKPDYAEKRAIWELFQNALDTVNDNGEIEITKTEKGFLFKHNGRPFKDDEFGGLIKQFSVGKKYGDNKEKLGQYGTGFISTHVYGKKIFVNGSIQTDDGTYRTLKDFILDREAENPDELTDKLLKQDDLIEELCDSNQVNENLVLPYTSYEYLASEGNRIFIDNMLEYVSNLIPYIFCFNNKLQVIKLHDGTFENEYIRKETTNELVHITKNNKPIHVSYIQNEENGVKVILGSEEWSLKDIPKQFLFYPLMETVDTGYNFIIHANDFKPNKERDYLHKGIGSIDLKEDIETNEKLLKSAFDLVLNKVISDESVQFLEICKIRFKEGDSNFETQLKFDYISKIKDLDRLVISYKKCCISSIQYFDKSILLLHEENRKSIYSLLSQFRSLPPFEEYCLLSDYVNNWNENLDEKFCTLTLTDIAEVIDKEISGNYFYINDKKSFQKFISEMANDISLLNRIALIPNIHGDFMHFENLVKWETKEPLLIEIVDSINVLISEKYIHEDFEFLENIIAYNREKFKDDFSKFCNRFSEDISSGKLNLSLIVIKFNMLLLSLNNFVGLNKKTQLNIEIANFYKRVFSFGDYNFELNDPTVEINYQPAIKLLANLYIQNLQDEKIQNHLLDLKEIISIMFKNLNLKEELLQKLACIPNQKYELKSQTNLKRDDIKDDDFKKKYTELTKEEILNEIAVDGFEIFLQHSGSVSGSELGDKIETFLNGEKQFIPVDIKIIDEVLFFIEKISERPDTWGQWLPNINRMKEEILMHKFKDEKTRSSLFCILTKDLKTIELLGDLAKIENLEDLVTKAKEKQKEENRKNNHLKYINFIGLTIQDLIQKQLDKELADTISVKKSEEDTDLVNQEEQNGQDFIIYKDSNPIYFIEVKSKWDENGRFALSKNQTEKCAIEKNRYAVISVNVDRYKKKHQIDNEFNIPFIDLDEFIRVNDDLGDYFDKLIKENILKSETSDPKLIEYRGSIPQSIIDIQGKKFDKFVSNLIELIVKA